MKTLSSNAPCVPPKATAVSLPITCAATWVTASGMTGLTLPGMIELPGCRSGRKISDSPVRGPLPIHRRSLAILMSATATRAQLAGGLDEGVAGALGREVVAGLGQRQPARALDQPGDHLAGERLRGR